MALLLEADELKMAEELEGTEEVVPRSSAPLVALSAAVKKNAPILDASNVALWAESGAVKVEVTHRESMRTFSAQLRAEDLEQGGFDPRDSAEECVALIVDVLSADDSHTVVVTPMAKPAEGSDTDTASVKVPFSECRFLRISFSIKIRTKLYEYSFVASEQKSDASTRTQLQLQLLKTEIVEVKAAMETMKAEMDALKTATTHKIEALKSKGIVSFRSNAMVGRFRKWNRVELAPTLDAMGALSRDQSEFRIGIEGVYRILSNVCIGGEMGSGYAQMRINGMRKCDAHGGKYTSTVLCFVDRLRVGDTVKVFISANENNIAEYNWLQVEKL